MVCHPPRSRQRRHDVENQKSRPLVLGFVVRKHVPSTLQPLVDQVVQCYRHHHADLRSVYVIGSVAIDEWTYGVSDIDIVGVVENEFTAQDEAPRREDLLLLDTAWPQVSFINNSTLSLAALHAEAPDPMVLGRARIIAVTGLHLWGDNIDFQMYMPSVESMAYGRAERAKILMKRYRAGTINEPIRSNPRLFARSCGKAALRVLSGITILRGAVFYASQRQTIVMVEQYVPEALSLATRALAIVDGKKNSTVRRDAGRRASGEVVLRSIPRTSLSLPPAPSKRGCFLHRDRDTFVFSIPIGAECGRVCGRGA